LLERYDNFDIYWYHWPEDGSLFWVEDYEPVIILYKGVEICLGLTQLKFLRYARPYLGRNSSQIRRVPCDTRAMKECFEIPELSGKEKGERFLTALAERIASSQSETRNS
jgi:hypothetical protein